MATTANSLWINPFESAPISIWNTVTGSNRTITLYGIWFGSALPNNDQIWHDVEYFGASGSPLASLGSGTKANNLATGSAWTADSTSVWNSGASIRTNGTNYSVGNFISVSTNTRLFQCTVGGTASASLPGGYASAIDGGTVTDGAATFKAGWRFSMAVTLSSPQPQLVGYLRSYVKAATASTTFYVDPLINLS
jgi:hypothetical protein